MKISIIEISVHQENESPLFGERNTFVRLCDEGAGQFVSIYQDGENSVRLDFNEVEYVVQAINLLKAGVVE